MNAAMPPLDPARAALLEGFGFAEIEILSPLEGGMFSRPLLLAADGARYALRTHTFRGTVESFRFQAEVLQWAAAGGVPCAKVRPTRDGAWCRPLPDGRGVLALHEFVEGACDDWGQWHSRKTEQGGFLRELGALAARMHNVLRRAPIRGDSSLSVELPPMQFDRLGGQERHWNRDLDRLIASQGASPAVRQLAALRPRIAEHWQLLRQAIEPRQDRLPRQVVHGDLSPVNLVLRPDGQWALIDWDCTHVGTRLYDALGDVLNRPRGDRPDLNVFRRDHVAEYLAGYDDAADEPFTDDERALIPAFCVARQLEDLRQRVRALGDLDATRHNEYAVLIARRVEMLSQIAAP